MFTSSRAPDIKGGMRTIKTCGDWVVVIKGRLGELRDGVIERSREARAGARNQRIKDGKEQQNANDAGGNQERAVEKER